jgi:HPr kinase/phosphorylase
VSEAAGQVVNVHATGVVLDSFGLLLRGPSGAGKSLLALALLDRWETRGCCLVADDRIDLRPEGHHLMMHRPDRIADLIELRGRGIVRRPSVGSARLHLVVDLVDELERMPEESAFHTELLEVTLDRCPVPRLDAGGGGLHQLLLIDEALQRLSAAGRTGEKTT